ncbi:MAG: hypothetical protein SRB2_04505 [Desulfobacteraceae bacterium Eth-SRB2]|nr:MAG: hypothetical protein SRB2_04505 [Desulfobacteraceae bacterium Eth-SRB2]
MVRGILGDKNDIFIDVLKLSGLGMFFWIPSVKLKLAFHPKPLNFSLSRKFLMVSCCAPFVRKI